ncbi:MAG: DUF4962 domain-containing protein [bacterium]|nr:DUF4962 domain-containing protein [bacterium]
MASTIQVTQSDCLPLDERWMYPRYLGFRPVDGQICDLNAPRFCWPFDPEGIPQGPLSPKRRFNLLIGRTAELDDPEVVVEETPYNFYNALPVLSGSGRWFWQVVYDPGTPDARKSRVRSFELAPDAVAWDRTVIEEIEGRLCGHPRIIFTPGNRYGLLSLKENDEECAEIARQAVALAEADLEADWFVNFPDTDTDDRFAYFAHSRWAQRLHNMAFAYMLTEDGKFLAAKDRLRTLAAYEPGGYASPEGIGKAHKFSTKITEHLGVAFDWFYHELSPEERETIVHSLDWRIEHTLNHFSWLKDGEINLRGIAVAGTSHAWENITWTLTGAMAVAEHSEVARKFVELVLHYFVGVGSGFAQDEGWNEGVSYSPWKFGSLVAASIYATMTIPELHLERNPFYRGLGEFFLYQIPVGVIRPAWGDAGYQYRYPELGQHAYRRKLAYFTGDGRLLQAREEWQKALDTGAVQRMDLGKPEIEEITDYPRPWMEYALKHFFAEPEMEEKTPRARIFPTAGWAMGYSEPPGRLEAFRNGVGFVMNCRPRGGYSHSHQSNGGFELFAYGQTIATGGGSRSNSDFVAKSSQSHNVVLIDGLGQSEVEGSKAFPNAGRIMAWKETPDLVYACSDVRNAYIEHPQLQRFLRHFLFVRNRYFVVFDDLALVPDAKPSLFSWLYHVQAEVPVQISETRFDYAIEDVHVQVHHLGETGPLEVENMQGDDWYCNPITGENPFERAREKVFAKSGLDEIWAGLPRVHNNLWVTTERSHEAQFLAVIAPWREGDETPDVQKLDSGVVKVTYGDENDVIVFGNARDDAFVVVDYEGMRM